LAKPPSLGQAVFEDFALDRDFILAPSAERRTKSVDRGVPGHIDREQIEHAATQSAASILSTAKGMSIAALEACMR
jgi:hypothetical protein